MLIVRKNVCIKEIYSKLRVNQLNQLELYYGIWIYGWFFREGIYSSLISPVGMILTAV